MVRQHHSGHFRLARARRAHPFEVWRSKCLIRASGSRAGLTARPASSELYVQFPRIPNLLKSHAERVRRQFLSLRQKTSESLHKTPPSSLRSGPSRCY